MYEDRAMIKISVIIPYFQREPGILRRALESVVMQRLPADYEVEVIVVDDGSPVSAQAETFSPPFHLNIIPQANAGVAAARNTGLKAVERATKYIAFLDSDDSWSEDHLRQGIAALEAGNDLYFCDNERGGVHASHFASYTGVIMSFIRDRSAEIINITKDDMETMILQQFPCQISTTIFRRSILGDLLFDTSLKNAGEDVIFFMKLVAKMQRVCFSPKIMVYCGSGINLYFSNMDWDSPGYLKRILDNMKAHSIIQSSVSLSLENRAWNNRYIAENRRKVAFHCLRYCVNNKGKYPPELKKLVQEDKQCIGWFMICAVQVGVGWLFGLYHPT